MNPKRRLTPAQTASAALAGVLALGVLILALSRPQRGHDVQAAAAALAARADATNAATPRELLSVLRGAAASDEEIRLITTDGRSIGRPLNVGLWSSAVSPVHGHSPEVAAIELSQPGADSGGTGFTHNAAIVGGLVALLGLMAAYGASARAQGAREARVTRDRSRDQVSASPPRVPPPAPPPALSDGDRRPMVGALLVVIDTLPDSPAGVRALRTLKQVGVETIEPTRGVTFDSRLHCVCGVVAAPDPSLVDSVAAVIRPGFIDRGVVLREADVQIYGSTRERTHAVPAVS